MINQESFCGIATVYVFTILTLMSRPDLPFYFLSKSQFGGQPNNLSVLLSIFSKLLLGLLDLALEIEPWSAIWCWKQEFKAQLWFKWAELYDKGPQSLRKISQKDFPKIRFNLKQKALGLEKKSDPDPTL